MTLNNGTKEWMDLQVNRCSKCGSCRDMCPVFKEVLVESYAPRARVQLIKYWLESELSISEKYREIMDMCLVCQTCTVNCPNGVQVHELVLNARSVINEEKGMNWTIKTALNMLKSPFKQEMARKSMEVYSRFMRSALKSSGAVKYLPGNLSKMESLLPAVHKKGFREMHPVVITGKNGGERVVYFTGCMTQMFYPEIGEAVIKVLEAAGCSVHIPRTQVCCGFPDLIYGNIGEAKGSAARNIDLFMRYKPDYIITDCASCGEALKHYSDYFSDIEGALSLSSLVQDISYFLVHETSVEIDLKPLDAVVSYHDPCHLKRGQGIHEEPRYILQNMPGLQFVEMSAPDRCCGGAGTFNILHYDMSMDIGAHKLADINNTGADIVATGCPACRTQIRHLIEQYGDGKIQVQHPVEVLARALG